MSVRRFYPLGGGLWFDSVTDPRSRYFKFREEELLRNQGVLKGWM